ncbi:cation:proton antiporter [Rubrivirga sp.]|uniref:cation:proton antiporter n=1 Tax=Rubrivirga sp. TaxID=1885344 RepID=UPI003C762230
MDALPWPAAVAFALLGLAFVLVFVRLVRGPSLPDRVVALDMVAYLAVATIALWTLVTGVTAYLDAALVLALIAFLATVAFGRYIEETPADPISTQAPSSSSDL